MRRKDKEIVDQEQIQQILKGNKFLRLAMVDDEGRPYIVPVNYGYEQNKLYIHSANSGRKIRILEKNNLVCFEIEHDVCVILSEISCECSTRYQSIIGYGRVKFVKEAGAKKHGLDVIMLQHGASGLFHYEEKLLSRVVILEITIESLTGKQSGY